MLILVEGGDGSGKTTLCNQLKDLGYKVVYIPRNEGTFDNWWRLARGSMRDGTTIICDRSFITDLVYRMLDDDMPNINLQNMLYILRYSKIIYCETKTSFEDGMARGEDNIIDKNVAERIKQIYRLFLKMFEKFADVKVLKFDWQNMPFEHVTNFINQQLI